MSDLYRSGAQLNGHPAVDAPLSPVDVTASVLGYGAADQRGEPESEVRLSVDHGVVREIRRQVAERLAARLQATPGLPVEARRELGRSLVAQVLEERARQRAHAGEPVMGAAEEYALAEAVMAALFGLGRLQPLVDDPLIENIEVNGCDRVWLSFADGREEPGPPVADSDAELIELLQLLAARLASGERSFTSTSPLLDDRLEDGSRLAATAWVTPRPEVVIRRHRVRDVDLNDLVRMGSIDTALAAFLARGDAGREEHRGHRAAERRQDHPDPGAGA